MYLISYRLQIGTGRHYAPSARAAIALIDDLRRGGGRPFEISTRSGQILSMAELCERAELEVEDIPSAGPPRWPPMQQSRRL